MAARSTAAPAWLRTRTALLRKLKLRSKTLLLISLTVVGLLVGLFFPLRSIMLASFLQLEATALQTDVRRAQEGIAARLTALVGTTTGYAIWDSSYAFVQGRKPDYAEIDLAPESLSNEDFDLVLVINTSREIVLARAVDPSREQTIAVPAFFSRPEIVQSELFAPPSDAMATSGIIVLPEGPMLVAARAILTSQGQGPRQGTMLLGRYLNDTLIEQVAEATALALKIYAPADPAVASTVPLLLTSDAPSTRPLNEERIEGTLLLLDLFGDPALVLRVEAPRSIYAQGQNTVFFFTGALCVVVLVFGVLMLALIDGTVLRRVLNLSREVRLVGERGTLGAALSTQGDDELDQLAQHINTMLSDLNHAEAERQRLREELFRSKERLLQMTIHDIKTPVSAITGYLDMLAMFEPLPHQLELIEGARRGNSQLLRLVQNLLDTARMEEGRLKLHYERADLGALFSSCAAELDGWATQVGKSIRVESLQPALHARIDVSLIQRVLLNLLSNALKHTPEGTQITLGAEQQAGQIRIWVWDDGPGIPADQQGLIFERFSTSDRQAHDQGSSGLGLTFCKLAAEAHQGTIELASTPGQGTRFTLVLPA